MRVTYWFVGMILLALTACSSSQKSFNTMSEEELFAYNLDRPIMDQVVCEKRRQSASRIRSNVCMTFREMAKERSNGFQKLQVLNYRAPSLGFNGSRR